MHRDVKHCMSALCVGVGESKSLVLWCERVAWHVVIILLLLCMYYAHVWQSAFVGCHCLFGI